MRQFSHDIGAAIIIAGASNRVLAEYRSCPAFRIFRKARLYRACRCIIGAWRYVLQQAEIERLRRGQAR